MEIIDFHAHPMYDFHESGHGVNIDNQRFRRDLEQCGITTVCGSVIYRAMENKSTEEYARLIPVLNDQAVACQKEMAGFYIPGIHVHPDHVELSIREMERCYEKDVRLIGELVPYMMGWKEYAVPGFIEIMERARELDMIVSMHPSNPEDMVALAEAIPGLNIVWAHFSGYGLYEAHLELMRKYENICFDISAHGTDYEGTLRHTIDCVGKDRILFGTDYPGVGPASDVAAVLFEDLTTEEQEAIFYKNAKRLLQL